MVKKSIFFILLFLAFTMVTSANADTLPVAMTTETAYTDKEVNFKFEYKVLASIDYSEVYSEFNPENMHVMPKLLTIGDLNMDGIKDIIIHHDSITSDGTGQAIDAQSSLVFLISNGAGGFMKNTSLFESIPTRVTVREGIVADFNGDGRNDFFGAANGVDGLAIGEQNVLMLSTPQGTLRDVSYTHLPLQIDFSHGAGAGDIDNDGDLDIFIANNQSLAKIDSYFLINNGTGTFTKDDSPSRISASLIKFSEINSGSNSTLISLVQNKN